MDRGAWPATVHGYAKSQTWLSEPYYSNDTDKLAFIIQIFATGKKES